jgi:hypothetical protein
VTQHLLHQLAKPKMRTIAEIRDKRRANIIEMTSKDVARLRAAGKVSDVLLIGSYFNYTFDSGSDIDLVCVVEDIKNPAVSSSDFSISSEKDIDLIFVERGKMASQPNWVREGIAL